MSGRPLAEVILDLQAAREAWEQADKRDDGDAMAEADDRLDSFRVEFRETFKERTGVAWSNVEAITMSGAL